MPDGMAGQHDAGVRPQASVDMENRLIRLENMLSQLLIKDGHVSKPTLEVDSPFSSDSESEEPIEPVADSKRKSKRKFRHAKYLKEVRQLPPSKVSC